jgi:hypothetical protein
MPSTASTNDSLSESLTAFICTIACWPLNIACCTCLTPWQCSHQYRSLHKGLSTKFLCFIPKVAKITNCGIHSWHQLILYPDMHSADHVPPDRQDLCSHQFSGDHCHAVDGTVNSTSASECSFKLPQLRHPNAVFQPMWFLLDMLDQTLHIHLYLILIIVSTVHHSVYSTFGSKCIHNVRCSQPAAFL